MERRSDRATHWFSATESLPPEVAPLVAALELSPDAVFVTSRLNRIVFWNASAEHLLGFRADEAVGDSCAGLLAGCDVHGNRYCTERCPVNQIATRHQPVLNFALRVRTKDGRTLVTDVTVLHLQAAAPDQFFLAHVLHPRIAEPVHEEGPAPPRPAIEAARDSQDARARKLTGREVEILGMLAAGHGTPEIAARLNISRLTARNHVQNILDKLEVHSKSEAVAFAFQKRLL